jgi:zinc-finger of transposase IS204/IS1001/IS1096/IS1165
VGQQGSASASRLLGLDGFQVLAAEVVGGEWQLEVQTTATMVGCTSCSVRATLHGRRTVRVRDLPIGGRPVVLRWRKRIWRCAESACGVRTWTEQTEVIRARVVLTQRAGAEACRGSASTPTPWRRSPATSALAGRPSCGRWLTTAARWWTTRCAWMASPSSAWTRPASSKPPGQHQPGM